MIRVLVAALLALVPLAARAAGDLSRQEPVEIVVELGRPDARYAFVPNKIELETGKLYKLVFRNKRPIVASSSKTRKTLMLGTINPDRAMITASADRA